MQRLLALCFAFCFCLLLAIAPAEAAVRTTHSSLPIQIAAVPSTPTKPVITTDSGLQYVDIEEGSGASPETGQTVVVHYTGSLEDGSVFDSSVQRNRPFEFIIGIGQVIKGWDEGVASMKVGGKRQLIIPSDLGYGSRGAGGVIPPDATLKFDVELLDIK